MKRHYLYASKFLLLGALALVTLSACNKALEDPEVVMDKAKEAIVSVTSGQVDITASMKGNNGEEGLSFSGEIDLAFDKSEKGNRKMDLGVDVSGNMQAADKILDGDLDLNFITVDQEYYIKLNALESSDESLTAVQPFVKIYLGKWLHIAEDFIPQDIRELQDEDAAMELKKKQLEDLFVDTDLFTVTKEYGIEKLNGQNVYHYGLAVNMDGFKEYISKAAIIDGRELTAQEVEEAVKILSYIKEAELYIDTEDYYILKSVFLFSGEALAEAGANLTVEIIVEGSDYNKSIDITAPKDSEEFNPLNLLMGLGGPAPVDDVMEDEVMEDDVMEDEVMEDDVEDTATE